MDINQILAAAMVPKADIRAVDARAGEILRLMRLKVASGSLRKGEICRNAIAAEMACRLLHTSYSRSKLLEQALVNEKTYSQAFLTVKHILQIEFDCSLEALAIKLGATNLTSDASKILQLYQKRYVDKLCPSMRGCVSLSQPVYVVAALHVAARRNKVKLDQKTLFQVAGVDPQHFKAVVNSVLDVVMAPASSIQNSKRQRINPTDTNAQGNPHTHEHNEPTGMSKTVGGSDSFLRAVEAIPAPAILDECSSVLTNFLGSVDPNPDSQPTLELTDASRLASGAVTAGGSRPKRSASEWLELKERCRIKREESQTQETEAAN